MHIKVLLLYTFTSKSNIFIVEIQKYFLFIYLVYNSAFFRICRVNAVQDDISTKTVHI